MTKIMLVEDDKSLREIYGVRLLAEGYDIVSAGDGEEALAMAIKERPQLVISDVMMPKISGYDMLDILRSTTETKDIRVIMMTALSSEDQRKRGESLGADRYLVKSQVGIEDVVRVVHEVLEDRQATPAAPVAAPQVPAAAPTGPVPAAPAPYQAPVAPAPVQPAPITVAPVQQYAPAPAPTPLPTPVAPVAAPVVQPVAPAPQQFAPAPVPAPTAVPSISMPAPQQQPVAPAPTPAASKPMSSIKTRIIQPLNDPTTQPPDINQLLDAELAKEAGISPAAAPAVQTIAQEEQSLAAELAKFDPNNPNGIPLPPPPPGAPNA